MTNRIRSSLPGHVWRITSSGFRCLIRCEDTATVATVESTGGGWTVKAHGQVENARTATNAAQLAEHIVLAQGCHR